MASKEAEALKRAKIEELRLKELQEMNRKLDLLIERLKIQETAVASAQEAAVASVPDEKKPQKSGK